MPSILYIFTRNSVDSRSAADGLEALMASCAMELEVSVAFVHDGVFILQRGQGEFEDDDPMAPLKKGFKAFGALYDFGVENIWVYDTSLQSRAVAIEEMSLAVQVCNTQELAAQLRAHDQVLVF